MWEWSLGMCLSVTSTTNCLCLPCSVTARKIESDSIFLGDSYTCIPLFSSKKAVHACKVVSAYLQREQILPVGFVRQHSNASKFKQCNPFDEHMSDDMRVGGVIGRGGLLMMFPALAR